MMALLPALANMLISWGSAAIEQRINDKAAFQEAHHRRLMKAAESEADWQAVMASASANSWKDEAWTICFIIILIMCFIPSLQSYVAAGFAILQTTPDWFRWAMLASIGASFGLRGFTKFQTGRQLSELQSGRQDRL